MKSLKSFLTVLIFGALATVPGRATAVTGEANISGTATVNNTGIYFNSTGQNTINNYNVESPNTGDFAGLTGGTIKNIIGPPTSGPDNIAGFATFDTLEGVITFDLQMLNPGVGHPGDCTSNTVGNVCTPLLPNGKLSPFTLLQVASNQVTISLSLSGIAYLGSKSTGYSNSPFVFTDQNTIPGTITGILQEAGSSKGITNSYSATISASPVPETASSSLFLFGGGLLALALAPRRRRFVKECD